VLSGINPFQPGQLLIEWKSNHSKFNQTNAMYYICKFSGTWSLYDEKTSNSRLLDAAEIDCLKRLFPRLVEDNTKILVALQITTIQPNRLAALVGQAKPELPKRQAS
jgi:hypothetical protein